MIRIGPRVEAPGHRVVSQNLKYLATQAHRDLRTAAPLTGHLGLGTGEAVVTTIIMIRGTMRGSGTVIQIPSKLSRKKKLRRPFKNNWK